SDANLSLTADFSSGDGSVFLVENADGAGAQEVTDDAFIVSAGNKLLVVAAYRGNKSGRAIGRRRHHASTGSVLFIYRHGKSIHPVHGIQRFGVRPRL